MTTKNPIPVLSASPFAPVGAGGENNLDAEDRAFLNEQENIIDVGKRAYLKLGTALLQIRDYKNGILYKRYGTFENYCRERWEISRSYAHRLMDAVGIRQDLLPRGNDSEDTVLQTTEKQIRALGQLKTPELRRIAWKEAAETAGEEPIRASDVAKAVRATMVRHGVTLRESERNRRQHPKCYRLLKTDLTKIRRSLGDLRKEITNLENKETIESILAQIETHLPSS